MIGILVIIMLVPMALVIGIMLVRALFSGTIWIVLWVILVVLGLALNIVTAPYRFTYYSTPAPASASTPTGLGAPRWAACRESFPPSVYDREDRPPPRAASA